MLILFSISFVTIAFTHIWGRILFLQNTILTSWHKLQMIYKNEFLELFLKSNKTAEIYVCTLKNFDSGFFHKLIMCLNGRIWVFCVSKFLPKLRKNNFLYLHPIWMLSSLCLSNFPVQFYPKDDFPKKYPESTF